MAACFIKLFDNVGVVQKETPPNDKAFWLAARKCMALVFYDGVDAWFHATRLADIRTQLIEQKTDYLSIGEDHDSIVA